MLERELTYSMPFERLAKLSRLAGRKAFATSWLLVVLLLAAYGAGLAMWIAFGNEVDAWLVTHSLPAWLPLAALIAMLALGIWGIRRLGRQQMKSRADFESAVRFREEGGGLRVATPEIEYHVKWHGISQLMLIEKEGVLFSHGALFFLVPNEAFRDAAERDALARDVFARLSDKARERSMKFIPPRLIEAGSTTGT